MQNPNDAEKNKKKGNTMKVNITVDLEKEGTMRKIVNNTKVQEALRLIGEELWKENIRDQIIFHLPTGNVVYNPIQLVFDDQSED